MALSIAPSHTVANLSNLSICKRTRTRRQSRYRLHLATLSRTYLTYLYANAHAPVANGAIVCTQPHCREVAFPLFCAAHAPEDVLQFGQVCIAQRVGRRSATLTGCIFRVGQNHIYTVYIRYFWQGNHQIYGHIRCIYLVLVNPMYIVYCTETALQE
jgi:hypothetical protein